MAIPLLINQPFSWTYPYTSGIVDGFGTCHVHQGATRIKAGLCHAEHLKDVIPTQINTLTHLTWHFQWWLVSNGWLRMV